MTRTGRFLFVPILLLLAGFFFFVSRHRLVDGDEGFYLLASRLVLEHKAPYLDFVYVQAPLLPYVYALWFKLAGISWLSARTLAALLTTAVGGLIYAQVCAATRRSIAGVAAVILFASSSLIFAWYPVAKTFSLAMLFLFSAYVILARLSGSSRGWQVALAGLLFGLSVDTRSYVVGVAPAFLWWLWRQRHSRRSVRTLWFGGGFLVGIVPSLALFFASPSAFIFNNLGYHAMRTSAGLIGIWQNKGLVVLGVLGGSHTGFQFSALVAVCLGLMFFRHIPKDASLLALVLATVLSMISLLPTPPSVQYFAMVMPFLIVAAVCLVSDYFASLRSQRMTLLAGPVCVVLLASFIGFGAPSFRQYLYTGYKVPGLRDQADAPNWTLGAVTDVSRVLDQLISPGEKVASFWPGYIFESRAEPYPGFENNFGMLVAERFTPEMRRKYHLISNPELRAAFAGHGPRIVVVGNQSTWSGAPEAFACIAMLEAYGYKLRRSVGDTAIYEWCSTPACNIPPTP